jgi:hypothetical protein
MATVATMRLPAYQLAAIAEARRKIIEDVSFSFDEVPMIAGNFEAFRSRLRTAFPSLPRAAVDDTLATIHNRVWTEDVRDEFAWRFAGNLSRLRQGLPALPWTVQKETEWVLLEVLSASPGQTDKGEPGAFFSFLVHAGTPCPALIRKFWERKLLRYVARELGFPRPHPNVPYSQIYRHPRQLVGFQLYGLCEADTRGNPRPHPMFQKVRASAGQQDQNRALIRARAAKPCPTAPFHLSVACHDCGIGQDQCALATHARTYVAGYCPVCNRENVALDPAKPQRCVQCRQT